MKTIQEYVAELDELRRYTDLSYATNISAVLVPEPVLPELLLRLKETEDKLTAAEKRIAELGGHLKSAHAFIENTEAFGHEAASGILKCGDSEWNVDASKESLTTAGITVKGE